MHERFAWSTPPGCPADLPLPMLEVGDARQLATKVSCFQDIAGDGAFSLGMIAEYREGLVHARACFIARSYGNSG